MIVSFDVLVYAMLQTKIDFQCGCLWLFDVVYVVVGESMLCVV